MRQTTEAALLSPRVRAPRSGIDGDEGKVFGRLPGPSVRLPRRSLPTSARPAASGRRSGGVRGRALTLVEREEISRGLVHGHTLRQIAVRPRSGTLDGQSGSGSQRWLWSISSGSLGTDSSYGLVDTLN